MAEYTAKIAGWRRRAIVFTSEGAAAATVAFDRWLADHPEAELLHVIPSVSPIQYTKGERPWWETVHSTRYSILVVYGDADERVLSAESGTRKGEDHG